MSDSTTVQVLSDYSSKTSSMAYSDAISLLINKWSTHPKSSLPLHYPKEFKSIMFFVSMKKADGSSSYSVKDVRSDRCGKWRKSGTPSKNVKLDGVTYTLTVATFTMEHIALRKAIYDLRKETDVELKHRCLVHVYSENGTFDYQKHIPPPHGNSKKKKPFYGVTPPMIAEVIDKQLSNNKSSVVTYNNMTLHASSTILPV